MFSHFPIPAGGVDFSAQCNPDLLFAQGPTVTIHFPPQSHGGIVNLPV